MDICTSEAVALEAVALEAVTLEAVSYVSYKEPFYPHARSVRC
jgi:hypothetical protein